MQMTMMGCQNIHRSKHLGNFCLITGIIKMARDNRNASDDDAKLLSSEPYPLVMDAPLSAFDKRRIKTVCEALPNTAGAGYYLYQGY